MTILVGNNIVNIAMSSLATGLLAVLDFGAGESVLISTFGITTLVLLFGESVPKAFGLGNAQEWALTVAPPDSMCSNSALRSLDIIG